MGESDNFLQPLYPLIIIMALIFGIGILFPLLNFVENIFWLVIVAVVILAPICLLSFLLYKAYNKNENVGKFFIVLFFAFILLPQIAHPAILDTRVTLEDIEDLRIKINENHEATIQTLNVIKDKELVCEIPETNQNFIFIVFPIIVALILQTALLIFFLRNR